MRIMLALVVCIVPVACVSERYSLPTAGQLATTGNYSAATIDRLERGRTLAITECSECHRMVWPQQMPSTEWPALLRDMGRRASLDPGDIGAITQYFTTVSEKRSNSGDQR